MKIIAITIVSAFCLAFLSCNNKKTSEKPVFNTVEKNEEENSNPSKKEDVAENFDEFNKKFHSDSLFQVSRVDFPIDGKHISGFEQHDWNRKNWQFHAIPVGDETEIGEYEHSLFKSDTLITERFWIPDSGFEVERHFKLIDNKWFLIYYNDINL